MLETDVYLYEDHKAKCTDCFDIKDMDKLYGSLNKIHDYDDKWMNDLFTEDDWLNGFSSGYLMRSMHLFPKQGEKSPWRNNQNYFKKIP